MVSPHPLFIRPAIRSLIAVVLPRQETSRRRIDQRPALYCHGLDFPRRVAVTVDGLNLVTRREILRPVTVVEVIAPLRHLVDHLAVPIDHVIRQPVVVLRGLPLQFHTRHPQVRPQPFPHAPRRQGRRVIVSASRNIRQPQVDQLAGAGSTSVRPCSSGQRQCARWPSSTSRTARCNSFPLADPWDRPSSPLARSA